MARARVRLLFLIRQLGFGGAERQLLNLVSGLDPTVFEVHVATMYRGGGLVPSFEAVPHLSLHSLDKAGRWDLRAFLSRLSRLSRMVRPDIVHGYMARPTGAGGNTPAIIVVHEWWGLNDNIKAVVDRYAGEGYLCLLYTSPSPRD